MGDFPPRGIRIRREHLTRSWYAAPAWALLSVFIVYGSAGTWDPAGRGIWAPIQISLPDVAQNVLLFLPFGVFGLLSLRNRNHAGLASVAEITVLAALFSLLVEVLQLYTIERTASVTDVVASIAGACIGALAAENVASSIDRAVELARTSGLLDAAELPAVLALVVAMTFLAWVPFDVTLDVSTLSERTRAVRQNPWQAESGTVLASQALRYALLAVMLSACMPRLGTMRVILIGAGGTIATVVALGAGQLAMGSEPIGLAGLLSQIVGGFCGVGVFATCRGR